VLIGRLVEVVWRQYSLPEKLQQPVMGETKEYRVPTNMTTCDRILAARGEIQKK
jgi:hypothetical protein